MTALEKIATSFERIASAFERIAAASEARVEALQADIRSREETFLHAMKMIDSFMKSMRPPPEDG